jgi:DNA topoisomerase-1
MGDDGMPERVLVVESGAKTRTIRGFLGGDYDVVASGGHIVDLPDDELGVDVEHDFSFRLEPIDRGGRDAVEALRSRLEGADEVYLATDPDREGEAIAADIRDHALPEGCSVHRIEFNAIVYPVVKEALESPRAVDEDRVAAQRARRSLDRLIGFVLSRVAQFHPDGPHLPSVGRVQSPAVRLVVDREREREAFEVRRYWTLSARVSAGDEAFRAQLDGEWEEDEFGEARAIAEGLTEGGSFTVESCEVDEQSEDNPLPPYTTDALQNDADFLLDVPPERTMELAQRLYEGVELGDDGDGGSAKALVTYMRTDSTRVSPSALNRAKEALSARDDLGAGLYRGRTWQAGGGAQDAHEAIRPTHPEDPDLWPENLEGRLDPALLALYRMIYWRFLASQMAPAVYRTTELSLRSGEHMASATGHELREPGFLRIWREVRPDHGREEVDLPEAEAGAELPVDRAWPEPQQTRPPARYREGSLVSELKDRGIGRPSTYSDILSRIRRSTGVGYVRKQGKTLRPTERGEALVDFLRGRFPRTVDYEYTARMEADLDRIEEGELGYHDYLEQEFAWLEEPYEVARDRDWLDADRPTIPQIEYLEDLAEETGVEVPEEVFESKEETSAWIDRLKDERQLTLRLTDIHEADVRGVGVHRFRLYYNTSLPDEEREFLKERGLKYRPGDDDHPPGYQYQRQDRSVVEEVRDEVRERYAGGDAPGEFE